MASSSYQELADKISDAGDRLLEAPLYVDKLLPLLEEVESYLSKVEQSPPSSFQEAISSSAKALKRNELLTHSDDDVRVAVASCISEITRVTAPEIPYSDDTMKEIFCLIVSTFEKLHDISSVSYRKRVSIIETVAKVRSCVLMLDLECDSLVDEMFQHFFKSVRDYHPDIVICSMITIMTLVIEESEDISGGILNPLLDSVKFDNKELSPVAWKLGEKVLQKCASKIKPYLIKTVKNSGIILNDYSNVVSCIFLEPPEQKYGKDSSENQVIGKVQTGTIHAEEAGVTPKQISNGVVPEIEDGYLPGSNSSDKCKNKNNGVGTSNNNYPSDGLHTNKLSGAETKAENLPKKRGRKPKPKINLMEACQNPRNDKETSGPPKGRETNDVYNVEVEAQLDQITCKNSDDIQILRLMGVDGEGKDVASPTPHENSPNKSRNISKRKGLTKGRNKNMAQGDKNPEEELLGRTRNTNATDIMDGIRPPESPDMPKSGSKIRNSKKKTARLSGKDVDSANKGKPESVTVVEGKVKRRRGRPSLSLVESTRSEDVTQEMISTPKPNPESTKVEVHEESRKESSKGKRTSETNHTPILKTYGPKLVGKRIKVWWPDDEMYYEGVIQSFIPTKKMHKVVYVDDDIEILDLRNEKWVLVDSKHVSVVEGDNPGVLITATPSPPASGDRPKKRTKSKIGTPPAEEGKQPSSKRRRNVKSIEDSSGGGVKKRSKGKGGGGSRNSMAEDCVDDNRQSDQKRSGSAATTAEVIDVTTDKDEESPTVVKPESGITKGRKRAGKKPESGTEKKTKKKRNV